MLKVLFVGLGGFVGAMGRYAMSVAFPMKDKLSFPLTTLVTNFLGAFFIGLIWHFSQKIAPLHPYLLAFLTVGVLGGFTTFSTFSLETINLLEGGKTVLALLYALASVVLCMGGVVLGRELIRLLA